MVKHSKCSSMCVYVIYGTYIHMYMYVACNIDLQIDGYRVPCAQRDVKQRAKYEQPQLRVMQQQKQY